MEERFLKAKHWQLFLLTFCLPLIFQFIIMGSMITGIGAEGNPDPTVMFNYMKFFPIMLIVILGVHFGWFWFVATRLQSRIPEEIKMKVKKFKTLFLIPTVYILLLTFGMGVFMNGILTGTAEPSGALIGVLAVVFLLLHMFSMFCIFYTMYFVAKTIKTVEYQREVKFSDFAGEFFLIWFYPIGVWILQPKINKMAAEMPPSGE